MSLQWTVVASILYVEIAALLLLLLPWLRPSFWNRIFKSRFAQWVKSRGQVYYIAVTGVLFLLFIDAIREVRKYAAEAASDISIHHTAGADNAIHMRLFRAQRNLYVSGFALLLFLILKRLVSLLSHGAYLEAAAEAGMRQAESANKAAKSLLSGDSEHITKLEELLEEKGKELKKIQDDRDTMKKQVKNLQKEYDRICDELGKIEGDSGDRKSKKSD